MAGVGPEPIDRRQAWFGPAYLRTIAAQAGYPWEPVSAENDVHSLDGWLMLHPGQSTFIQVKCFRGRFREFKSYLIKDAWRENWRALVNPAYFVVVEVTPDVTSWLEHDENARTTLERASAYWTRIDGIPDNQRSIRVKSSDRLTASTLEQWRHDLNTSLKAHGYMMDGES